MNISTNKNLYLDLSTRISALTDDGANGTDEEWIRVEGKYVFDG